MNRRALVFLSLAVSFARGAHAQSAKQIAWEHLVPKGASIENPFTKLAPEHLAALIEVASVRERRAAGVELTSVDIAAERVALAKLKDARIDPDHQLSLRKEVAAKLFAQARATNPALDKRLIRMPGYLLPLEFIGQHVAEFLLVPYVGACIHSPPPPPNQIVYVKLVKPIEVRTTFDPVWITGRLSIRAATKSLHLVDGNADIDVGYAMEGAKAEPYRQ